MQEARCRLRHLPAAPLNGPILRESPSTEKNLQFGFKGRPTMVDWEFKSKSSTLDNLDSSMYIQCYSVPTGRVSTLMVRPPSSNSSLDIDIEVAEINNNVGR